MKDNQSRDVTLAMMAEKVAEVVEADRIICLTETGSLARALRAQTWSGNLIVATANAATRDLLSGSGTDVLQVPIHSSDKDRQVRHVLSVALKAGRIQVGDRVVCVIGFDVYAEGGMHMLVVDVEAETGQLLITDMLKLTDSIRPQVLQSALVVAAKIGRVVRRGGVRAGTILMIGDSLHVLEGSRQLIPNPFQGHNPELRMITNSEIHDTMVELAKLDGAFVLRGDGYVQSAATFLAAAPNDVQIPAGLGTRHVAAAAVTARTAATAVVVSATDGNTRVFSGGKLVLQLDPDAPYGPLALNA